MADDRCPPRIGVFGGTFDPVHVGHLIAASELRHALDLERVLFVPAGRPPHKRGRPVGADGDRVAMLRLAIAHDPRFEISLVDLGRDGPSFTSDLLARLRERLVPADLIFLMGEDSLRDLPNWHEPGRIATLAELGVASRSGVDLDPTLIHRAVPETRDRIRLVDIPGVDVSSSDLQRRVAAGDPIRYLVPLAVERYIREHGLYRPPE